MAIIGSSTTDSQEEVNKALGLPKDTPRALLEGEEPEPPKESTSAASGANGAPKPETTVESETTPGKDSGKRTPNEQKRIDRLTARATAAEKERDELRQKWEAANPPKRDERPAREKYQTQEAYENAVVDWRADQKIAERQANEQKAQRDARAKENFDGHVKRLEDARKAHEDFDEACGFELKNGALFSGALQTAIVELDNSAEVLYYLGTHQDEAQKLGEIPSAIGQVAAIGRISAKISSDSPASKPTVSKAPPPIEPVGARDTRSARSIYDAPEDISQKDWVKMREASMRRRN